MAAQSIKNKTVQLQQVVVIVSVALLIIKFLAYYITHSLAILTDALESIVNVIASMVGIYSLKLSLKPRDEDHPYGHRKAEFISSAFEGMLVSLAGIFIIYEALMKIHGNHDLQKMDIGFLLIIFTAVINLLLGFWCKKVGTKNSSPILYGTGVHLHSDTLTTVGILVGIILIYFTHLPWLDSIVAMIFAFIIIFTGYKIIKKSMSGMMDEMDKTVLDKILATLNTQRRDNWIDIHNLRIIDYAGFYHVDCHLTVPYYYNVLQAHDVVDEISDILNQEFENNFEFFIHTDPCIERQCFICEVKDCPKRQHKFSKKITWTESSAVANEKHSINTL